MSRIGLNELEAALAVARRGSFHQAAIDLNVSTSALSTTIAKLETAIDTRLFNRTTRSVSLTEAGTLYLQQVGPALENIRAALGEVRSRHAEPAGVLRINAFASAARSALLPLMLEFIQRYPKVHIDLVTEGRLVDIVADGFDLGLRARNLVPADMIVLSLGQAQRYAIVASPAYLNTHGRPASPADLLNHPCIRIRLPNGSLYPWHLEKDGEHIKLEVNGPLTLDDASVVKAALKADAGLGLLMEQDVQEELDTGLLERVLQDWTPPRQELCLYYPNRRNPSAALKAFIDLAREHTRSRH
ncbi:LysR family transcriptional regulator [Pseudomonas abyssi]|uniref:LysR family transcriptional regulator n=1 Tax=Pseudomonas abyssi TaxID=170540 RepID=A0A395RB40_9PSED|nr:LysR family transcriptional regulator [Halopseudomonas gallaeciensis]